MSWSTSPKVALWKDTKLNLSDPWASPDGENLFLNKTNDVGLKVNAFLLERK